MPVLRALCRLRAGAVLVCVCVLYTLAPAGLRSHTGFAFKMQVRMPVARSSGRTDLQRGSQRSSSLARLSQDTEFPFQTQEDLKDVAHTGFEDVARCPKQLREASCYFLDGATVSQEGVTAGYGFVATRDLRANTIVIVEQRIIDQVPAYLTPRNLKEVPSVNMGLPQFVVPEAIYELFPSILQALQISQNAHAPLSLYGMGSALNHCCKPSTAWVSWPDGLRALMTKRDIASGEELTISSFGADVLTMPTWYRQLNTFWRYGYSCRCSVCNGQVQPEVDMPKVSVDKQSIRRQVDELLFESGMKCPQPISADASYWVLVQRLAPLAVLQSVLVSSLLFGVLFLIPDSWLS